MAKKLTLAGTLLTLVSGHLAGLDTDSAARQPGRAADSLGGRRAPGGAGALAVEWIKLAAPGLGVMLAAAARPPGAGPFSTVVLLHGTHGFAPQYVQLAQDLSRSGLLEVAACWFSGGGGPGSRFLDPPISYPEAPPQVNASSPQAFETVGTLVEAVRTLPGARSDRVGLFGHSRGGGATRNILRVGNVQAAVLDSAGYITPPAEVVAQLSTPILILHGTADGPAEGGSALTDVERARDFEAALRRVGGRLLRRHLHKADSAR